jgi:nitroreductase
VLDAARFAPSAENTQPWVFVVVRDADRRAALTGLMERLWAAAPDRGLPSPLHDDVDAGFHGGFASAPVLVVVGGDEDRAARPVLASSVYPAVQNLLLAATALGLGSAMTTIATADPGEVRAAVAFPDHIRPLAVVPLGWPARPLGPPRRRPLTDVADREAFGQGW